MQVSEYPVSPLVSNKWLAQRLDDPDIRIIDARPTILYSLGHIRNAVNAAYSKSEYLSFGVDVSRGGGVELYSDPDAPTPSQDAPPEMIAEVLGHRLGINSDSIVVIYSDGNDALDTRFWWTLERLGHKKMYILAGGLDKWEEDGYKTIKKKTGIQPVEYMIGKPSHDYEVDTNWVLEHLANPEVKLVFNANFNFYYGQSTVCPREGHIAGSVCVPVPAHFNEDSTWKSPAALRSMYHHLGITEDKTVITYCPHNVVATTGYFALRHILGYRRVKVYAPSQAGWCYDPRNLPLETYGNPQLLRDTKWAYYWADHARQRMIDTRVRVIDARSAAEYKQGHIPSAVNFPAEEVHISDEGISPAPRKIRAMLGKLGISADTRVLIYDQGNALQAAWLFWVLEYLGHPDVSILNGGFTRCQAEKRKVATTDTPIRKSKPEYTYDLSIRPTTFKANLKPSILATSDLINKNAGNPDRVLLNADDPAGTGIAEAKHVPWTGNVTEEGIFKTAAQLAKIYHDTAGINPFKEVVCRAETPVAAAHAYFALRLLGYPRVRLSSQT